jgi:hypothetical protein
MSSDQTFKTTFNVAKYGITSFAFIANQNLVVEREESKMQGHGSVYYS